jgi:hypothetical protein
LPQAPPDPFNGKPFQLAHRDGQFLIYSVGPNGKDEQGNYDSTQWLKGGPDDIGTRAWDFDRRRQPPAESNTPAPSRD